MGSIKEPGFEFVDTGTAPEFFVDHIGRQEVLGGNIRTYMCAKRGNLLVVQYTSIIPVTCLAVMARIALIRASDAHNKLTLMLSDDLLH